MIFIFDSIKNGVGFDVVGDVFATEFKGFLFLPLLQKSVKVLKILFDSDRLVTS